MKNILVIGAGRSTSVLIQYLLTHSQEFDWKITVADQNKEHAVNRIAGHAFSRGGGCRHRPFKGTG